MSQLSNNRACLFGTASVLFSFFFVVALLAVHVLEPEMNQGSLSFYSLGPYGLIMRLGFIALGLAFYFLVLGLNLLPGAGNFRYVDLLLLLIAGTGLLLIGVFDADGLGASSTISGNVHRLSANAWSLGAAFGAFFFAPAFLQHGRSLTVGRKSRNLALGALVVWSGGFFVYGTFLAPIQPRLFFAVVLLWILLIAFQLRAGKLPTTT